MKQVLKRVAISILSIVVVFVAIGALFVNFSPEFGAKSKGVYLKKVKASENYVDGKFQNMNPTKLSEGRDYSRILDYFSRENNTIPNWSIPVIEHQKDYFLRAPENQTRITWFGHSAVLLEIDGQKLFLDPMLGSVPAPHPLLGTKRFNSTLPLAIEKLPYLDAVLISHDHYDHLDYSSILKIKDKVGVFYVPLGLGAHLRAWGVAPEKIKELDWWQEVNHKGIKCIATPSRHFSGRGLFDGFSTLWCSWVVKGQRDNVFFGGDSGYDSYFKQIGDKYGPFDIAMLECGQYDKQWPEIHMMPEQTVQANIDLNSNLLMPIHWGAFKLSFHEWDNPVKRALKKAKELNVQLTTPIIGESVILHSIIPTSKWWIKDLSN